MKLVSHLDAKDKLLTPTRPGTLGPIQSPAMNALDSATPVQEAPPVERLELSPESVRGEEPNRSGFSLLLRNLEANFATEEAFARANAYSYPPREEPLPDGVQERDPDVVEESEWQDFADLFELIDEQGGTGGDGVVLVRDIGRMRREGFNEQRARQALLQAGVPTEEVDDLLQDFLADADYLLSRGDLLSEMDVVAEFEDSEDDREEPSAQVEEEERAPSGEPRPLEFHRGDDRISLGLPGSERGDYAYATAA